MLRNPKAKPSVIGDIGQLLACVACCTVLRGKRTKKDDLTDSQWDHMEKVIGYIHRHLSQRPDGDVKDTDWRYSLMNWGHDPLKDD